MPKNILQKGKLLWEPKYPRHICIFGSTDTGLGIDPTKHESIFEPFVTIEENRRIAGGIGLGLSITRHLVALHGGTMKLESELNKGSTFQIYLPLTRSGLYKNHLAARSCQSAFARFLPAQSRIKKFTRCAGGSNWKYFNYEPPKISKLP